MGVHTRPRRICDGDILNERIGGIGDDIGSTEQRRLDGKLESVGAAAVVTEAWLAPRQGRNKLGLFGILGRLVLAISAASTVSIPRSERSLSHYASARLRSSRPHRPGRTTTSGICYPLNTIALDRQISFAQVIRPSRFLAEPEEAP